MSIDTEIEKTSTWQGSVSALKDKLNSLMTSPDYGSLFSRYGESTNGGLLRLPRTPPRGYHYPSISTTWEERYTFHTFDRLRLESMYDPDLGIEKWLKWQSSLRDMEENLLQEQKNLVEKVRREWDQRGGDIGWEHRYVQMKWDKSVLSRAVPR